MVSNGLPPNAPKLPMMTFSSGAGTNYAKAWRGGRSGSAGSGGGAGAVGGGFPVERAQSYDAQIAQDPTRGARERMMRAQMAASQAGVTAAGGAVASGAFGSSRGAQLGGASLMAQAAAQGALAADQVAEQDLNRQQGAYLQDASLRTGVSQFNAGQGNDMTRFAADNAIQQGQLSLQEKLAQNEVDFNQFRMEYLMNLAKQQQSRGMVPWRPIV